MYSMLNEEQLDSVWLLKAGDWYEKVNPEHTWLECGRCGVLPRQWRFDNGLYVTCLCYDRYDVKPVRSESVMSIYKRGGHYEGDDLRIKWNLFARDGVERNKLESGRW